MAYPQKSCRPIGTWSWRSLRLKTYILATNPDEVSTTVLDSAQTALNASPCVRAASASAGFAIVHRCGTHHLLLACIWRNENELWESVWEDSTGSFALLDRRNDHLPTYCVWEMGIVTHETKAWRRLLDTPQDAAALDTYLDDVMTGLV